MTQLLAALWTLEATTGGEEECFQVMQHNSVHWCGDAAHSLCWLRNLLFLPQTRSPFSPVGPELISPLRVLYLRACRGLKAYQQSVQPQKEREVCSAYTGAQEQQTCSSSRVVPIHSSACWSIHTSQQQLLSFQVGPIRATGSNQLAQLPSACCFKPSLSQHCITPTLPQSLSPYP